MTDRNDGGSAFPGIEPSGDAAYGGMSLRDWFAGQALTGLMAAMPRSEQRPDEIPKLAATSFKFADAMLAAREAKR